MSPASNLAGNKRRQASEIMVDLDLCARESEGAQKREPKKDKPRSHDGTGSSRRETQRETKGDSLEIMMELKGGANGEKPQNHERTGSSRREDNGRQASKSRSNWIQYNGDEGRQTERSLKIIMDWIE